MSNLNHFNIKLLRFRLSYLEEKGISQCIAQTKHKVFLGMFWDSLNNAVLHPDCMFVDAVVVDPCCGRFIKKQSASWEDKVRRKIRRYGTVNVKKFQDLINLHQ